MNRTPIISIIVPVYNVEDYLSECLNSILCHDIRIQYLFVDDGSTDGSLMLLKSMTDGYANVEIIHQKNQGLSSARNAGLLRANGKWVYFIDSDDFVGENFLRKLITVLSEQKSTAILVLPVKRFGKASNILQDSDREMLKDEFVKKLVCGKLQFGVWSFVFNSKIIHDNGLMFLPGKHCEDQYFVADYLRFVTRIYQYSHLKIPFYYYRLRSSSITSKRLTSMMISERAMAESYRNKVFLSYVQDNSTRKLIYENRISILFRKYRDLIFIGDIDSALLERDKILKYRKQIKGALSFKIWIKYFLTKLPVSIFYISFWRLIYR